MTIRSRWAMMALAAMLSVAVGADTARNVQVTVDGEPLTFESPILMVDMQYPLLPAERFLGALGATTSWDRAAGELDAKFADAQLQMWSGRDWATIAGEQVDLEHGLQTLTGAPYVAGDEIARLLGFEVTWDQATLSLAVTSPATTEPEVVIRGTMLELTGAEEPLSLTYRDLDTGLIEQIQLAPDATLRRGREGTAPVAVEPADLQPGDLLEIGVGELQTATSVRATYQQQLGTIQTVRANQLTLDDGRSIPLGEGISAVGADGAPLHLLRTEGEAAILRLNPATGEVWAILAQRHGEASPPATEEPRIAAFLLPRYDRPLSAGDTLQMVLRGSAGAAASVIMGATGVTVELSETQPGIYETNYTVPEGMEMVATHLRARLRAGDRIAEARSIPEVMIDSSAPRVYNLTPPHDALVRVLTPTIAVSYQDTGPAGIAVSSVELVVDGADVTGLAEVGESRASWDAEGLAGGTHTVLIRVGDPAGNTIEQTWQFRIEAEGPIRAVSHDAEGPLGLGDTLTVTLEAPADGRDASFDVAEIARDVEMTNQEGTDIWQGTYTVAAGDQVEDARVTVHYTDAAGVAYSAVVQQPVTISAPVEETPFAVAVPEAGVRAPRRIRPSGTGPAGLEVRWSISYRKIILGGELSNGVATIAGDGTWQAEEEVDLRLPLLGMADAYTLEAQLVDAGGDVIERRTVNFTAAEN